jgi:hypothetical protein
MKKINEASECYVDYTVLDENVELITPSSMRYRIDCLTTGHNVLDWTDIATPDSEGTIVVTSAQNAMVSQCNRRERRQMIVETVNGTSIRNDECQWMVENFRGVS